MSDYMTGVAVLNKTNPTSEYLCVTAKRGDGHEFFLHLPVRPKQGATKVLEPQWTYEVVGDTLHFTPSVLCKGDNFHTPFSWSVRYQDFDAAKYEDAYQQWKAVNAPQPVKGGHD